MTRARITMAAVGAGLLVGLSVLAPTIASAKQATPPGMITRADVPAVLGTPKPGKDNYTITGMYPVDMGLCTTATSQPELTVGGAAGWQVTILLTGKGYRELNQRMSTFGSDGAASSTFDQLETLARQCNVVVRTPINADGNLSDGYYTDTTTTGMSGDNVWISTNSRATSKDPKVNGSVTTTYTVYSLQDNAIMQTWVYFNGTRTTTPAQRAAVNSLAS